MKETLAGRIALLDLYPLTWAERQGRADWNPLALALSCPDLRGLAQRLPVNAPATRLAEEVPLGGFPEPVLHLLPEDRPAWHAQYVRTYVERDVPAFVRPDDLSAFLRFVRLAVSATAGLLNMADLARDAGVSHDTARRWLSVLQSTYLVHLLRPFWRNLRKRLVKSPKLHVVDCGLTMAMLGVAKLAGRRAPGFGGASGRILGAPAPAELRGQRGPAGVAALLPDGRRAGVRLSGRVRRAVVAHRSQGVPHAVGPGRHRVDRHAGTTFGAGSAVRAAAVPGHHDRAVERARPGGPHGGLSGGRRCGRCRRRRSEWGRRGVEEG